MVVTKSADFEPSERKATKTIWICEECRKLFMTDSFNFLHYPLNDKPSNMNYCGGKVVKQELVSLDELTKEIDKRISIWEEVYKKANTDDRKDSIETIVSVLCEVKRFFGTEATASDYSALTQNTQEKEKVKSR